VDLFVQLVANGVVNGSHYALLALGFGLIFGTTRVVHFAYGPVYAVSAYGAWFFAARFGAPLWVAMLASIVTGVVVGVLSYLVVYRPFERRGSSPLVVLIASLGLLIVIENAIGVVFGTDTKVVTNPPGGLLVWGPLVVTGAQLMQLAAFVIVTVALGLYLTRSHMGKAVLAMTDNAEMARVIGIDTTRVAIIAFALGSAIAAVPACLILFKDGATAHMGFMAVFMAFVGVVVGGVGSLRGAVLGGLILGIVESTGMVRIPTEWQSSVAFVVLFLVLLVRPRGLFGGR
jgi:branched-chain amino acid transport system permease protein